MVCTHPRHAEVSRRDTQVHGSQRTFSLGQAKAYEPSTRASSRLAALRSQSAANPHPETPVTPTISAPTSSLPPKKCPIPNKAGEGTSKNQEAITISSDPEPEPEREEEAEDIEEDPKEDPVEAPQAAGIEEEENAVEEGVRVEDDFADCWAIVRSNSENSLGNDHHFDGNTAPAAISVKSCTGPSPAGN
ncbi:hypothetical protein PIB30_077856 [Stylosanthes scabra]|uniref:Uncharacterized protein n=1 Tax=Stylosanthes scabra TaxID=79078 RepID=A0ABU6YTE1_9FABA|nr:hypothetical protein [Stylosanthes scabra]